MKHYLVLLSLLLVVTATATLLSFLKVEYVQRHQNDALRSIMCRAESFVRKSPQTTPAQKRQAIRFYESALADAHLPSCSN